MKAIIVGLSVAASIASATAQDEISVNKGQWATSMTIFTAIDTGEGPQFDPPEFELVNECWSTDADTHLNLDWLDLDECTQSNAEVSPTKMRVDLYCSYDGVGMTGLVDIAIAPDKDSMQGYFKLSDDMGLDELSVDVVASFTAQKVGACTG